MAWSLVGVGATAETASGNLSLVEPAGVASGDLLVAAISYRDTPAFTLPTGWALVATQQSSGNISTTAASSIGSGVMAYIVRGGSAPSLAFTRTLGDVALGQIVAYRGNNPTPLDGGSSNTLAVASMTVTTASITTTAANDLLVAACCVCNNINVSAVLAATDPSTPSGATDTTTAPTVGAWIERSDNLTTTGADCALAFADAVKGTAGATGQFQYTDPNSERSVMIVGAFKIATAGGGGTLTASAGAVSITAPPTLLAVGRSIAAAVGSFLEAGVAARLYISRKLIANSRAFALSGNSASLIKSSGPTPITLVADPGAIIATGNAATITIVSPQIIVSSRRGHCFRINIPTRCIL